MGKSLSNEYYLYLHRGQEPISWDPLDPHPLDWVDYTYFSKVIEAMEKSLKVGGLKFYFTWDSVDELPSYGSNVVAIIVGDEWCRIPMYFHKVLAIFKCYGTLPILGFNLLSPPSYLNFLTLIQFLRTEFYRLPYRINYIFHKLKYLRRYSNKILAIYDIPLGYDRQLDLPIKNMEDRSYNIFFAGSVAHGIYSVWSLKNWFDNPKSLSRKKMISLINKVRAKHPELTVELSIKTSFDSNNDGLDKSSYSEKMMDTQICLVPRGTSFETFRYFEAMRYGCIVVGEALPSRWFYNDSPAIQINDWSELEIILPRLLENKALMREKHQESLNWWKTKCSEDIVGNYIANVLDLLSSN